MSNHEKELKDSENNNFVRILIIVLSLFITVLIGYNYFYSPPKGDINSGIVILLSFLIILSLSESFDNFSVGKIFSLEKTLGEKKSDISQLKTENLELRNQVVNISTSVSQGQMNANVFNIQDILSKSMKVKIAEKDEIEEKEQTEIKEDKESTEETIPQKVSFRKETTRKNIDMKKLEDFGLNKFIEDYDLHHHMLIRDAKLSTDFYNIDPISTITPLFDGYIRTPENEFFIEVKRNFGHAFYFRERLYLMLSKIHHYKIIKKSHALLVLILISTKEDEKINNNFDEINRFFEPAISSGLLKIITYTLDISKSSEIYRDEN